MLKGSDENFDRFVGETFPTKKGGLLTVTGISHRSENGIKSYTVECSICSQDTSLFKKPFKACKGALVGGSAPCGCGAFRYTKEQYAILVERYLAQHNPNIKLFKLSEEHSDIRYMKAYLLDEGGDLLPITPSVDNLLRGKSLKSLEKGYSSPRRTTTEKLISKLKEEGHYKKEEFYRVKDEVGVCEHTCVICSEDEFVQANLCNGWFKINIQNIYKGQRGCRCGWYILNDAQKAYKGISVCEEEGHTFRNIKDGKILWICENGHDCVTDWSDFYNTGVRCRYCLNGGSNFKGFLPEMRNRKDYLYLIEITTPTEKFLKVGRSFTPQVRFSRLKSDISCVENLRELCKLEGTHEYIYKTEQMILSKLRDFSYKPEVNFNGGGECFDTTAEKILIETVETADQPMKRERLSEINSRSDANT